VPRSSDEHGRHAKEILVNREKQVLMRHLEGQRGHVLAMLEGLSDEQLRRPVLPSGWHCLGLVKHLALSDEHYWFRCVVAGESQDYFPTEPNGDWQVGPDESAMDVVALYRAEIRRANEIIEATSLDAAPLQSEQFWAEAGMEFADVRAVIMHVITETSVHAGHLDAVRELIDGRQWIVL
jgi:uncharacterized damage-inducible protein DinB